MKPFFYTLIACGIGVLVLAPQARAQDATTDSTTYGQLSALTGQIAILKAQVQVAQLQQQIADAKKRADSTSAVPSSAQAGATGYPGGGVPVLGNTQPQVLSISGQERRLTALIQMPGGGDVEATPGTPLGNGMVVEYITPSAVQIMRDGQLVVLPFAGSGG